MSLLDTMDRICANSFINLLFFVLNQLLPAVLSICTVCSAKTFRGLGNCSESLPSPGAYRRANQTGKKSLPELLHLLKDRCMASKIKMEWYNRLTNCWNDLFYLFFGRSQHCGQTKKSRRFLHRDDSYRNFASASKFQRALHLDKAWLYRSAQAFPMS